MITLDEKDPKGIVWIASYPRSGNTWTRAFITTLFNILKNPDFEDVDINEIEEGRAVENAAALYPRFLGKPAIAATQKEIAAARPWVQAALVESAGRLIYLKTHYAKGLDHGTPQINMSVTLGAVYLVRNPLDVAISYAAFGDMSVNDIIATMATPGWSPTTTPEKVRGIVGSWSQHVESWTQRAHPAVLVMRYEDLVAKPERSFAQIARHLRTRPDKAQLRRAIALTSFDRLRSKEDESGFKERPDTAERFFRAGKVGQWREILTEEQVARVVAAHKPLMRRFGYLPGKNRA